MARPIDDDERARIVELIRAGVPRNEIARQTKRSPDTISRIAAAAGLTFDRTVTQKATEAAKVDAAARRADLVHRLHDAIDTVLAQMFAPAELRHHNTTLGGFDRLEIPEPTFQDKQRIATTIGILVDKTLVLEQHDRDPGGVSDVDRWLAHLTGKDTP